MDEQLRTDLAMPALPEGRVLPVVTAPHPVLEARCAVPFAGLELAELQQITRDAGAKRVRCFGDYQEGPYRRGQSIDLLMVAEK